MSNTLIHQLVKAKDLSKNTLERMYELMSRNYDHVSFDLFLSDLSKKDLVGLFIDSTAVLQGFTTYAIIKLRSADGEYGVVFSGDTIIDPSYWGTQEMMRNWCETVGSIIASDPTLKWYWYLMSKGHRTYMYLPLFFQNYYPALTPSPYEEELKRVADEVSIQLFPKYWIKEEGLIRFNKNMGSLKREHNEGTFQKRNKPHVAFFISKNPKFYEGEELVCITQIHPDNMLGAAKRFVMEGVTKPLNME